jgi:aldehyde:ferredoxin oxidoreductase
MENTIPGYYGLMLDINLTTGTAERKEIPAEYFEKYIGGRGLGMKLLWERLSSPGVDPLSEDNPLLFMAGPFSGFPIPSASRTCVVTKSPHTSALQSDYAYASTVTYSNMGGFIGPEIRFAGYDCIAITGKASSPVYIVVDDDEVSIHDATKFWGMGTDQFDKAFMEGLGDRRFRTCYIGPAGENQVEYACIVNTSSRATGRGGTGAVMGSKNLKAIAFKGSNQPGVADHKSFLELLEKARGEYTPMRDDSRLERYGTTGNLVRASMWGAQAVKNYREGTFPQIVAVGPRVCERNLWVRDYGCYCCPIACKKSGLTEEGLYAGMSHDGPEFETGTMFGPNLLVSDLGGLMKEIFAGDDYGLDILSTGNVIGFLMEAYEKGHIDKNFIDGIDLTWGNVDAVLQMIDKIGQKSGVGELCSGGVKALSAVIGQNSEKYAIHVKGQELAGWNVHVFPGMGIQYVTSNRGACHMAGNSPDVQNQAAVIDSIGLCSFAVNMISTEGVADFLTVITGKQWSLEKMNQVGERIFNLEKMFNYREGFRRADDSLPDRFFEDPLTVGPEEGAVLDRVEFNEKLNSFYEERDWDPNTTKPNETKLESLELEW